MITPNDRARGGTSAIAKQRSHGNRAPEPPCIGAAPIIPRKPSSAMQGDNLGRPSGPDVEIVGGLGKI